MPIEAIALTADQRRARVVAIAATTRARGSSFVAARRWYYDALLLDPTLDLATTPAFWQLPRAGLDAAVAAYEDAGLDRRAAILAAQIRHTFKPRLLPG